MSKCICGSESDPIVAHRIADGHPVCRVCLCEQSVIKPEAVREWPCIEVEVDFDGFFKTLVRGWLLEKIGKGTRPKHNTIHITAGPWRAHAISYHSYEDGVNKVLNLDFYSAVRAGFGALFASKDERKAMLELL